MRYVIDHLALVVSSIEATVERLGVNADLAAIEEFPGEGTRELYVGDGDQTGLLLLMQPIGPGPYRRALEKRGEGLHHVAFRVTDIERFAEEMKNGGWRVHPASEQLLSSCGQLWLYQSGVQTLIEVSEGEPCEGEAFIPEVRVAVAPGQEALVAGLNVEGLSGTADAASSFILEGRNVDLNVLFAE